MIKVVSSEYYRQAAELRSGSLVFFIDSEPEFVLVLRRSKLEM